MPSDIQILNRFRSLVELADEKLRAEEIDPTLGAIVGEIQRLAAETDEANALMEADQSLALRFDSVVSAWKELRHVG